MSTKVAVTTLGAVKHLVLLSLRKPRQAILAGVSDHRDGAVRIYDYDTGTLMQEYYFYKTYIYCCKFLTPSFVGIGGFLENSFHVVNVKNGEVLSSVIDLPGCVMSFALKQRVLQQRFQYTKVPVLAISSAEKVLEIETISSHEETTRT